MVHIEKFSILTKDFLISDYVVFLIAADGQKDSSLVDRPYEGGAL